MLLYYTRVTLLGFVFKINPVECKRIEQSYKVGNL